MNKIVTIILIAAAGVGAYALAMVIANGFSPTPFAVEITMPPGECEALDNAFAAKPEREVCLVTVVAAEEQDLDLRLSAPGWKAAITVPRSAARLADAAKEADG